MNANIFKEQVRFEQDTASRSDYMVGSKPLQLNSAYNGLSFRYIHTPMYYVDKKKSQITSGWLWLRR